MMNESVRHKKRNLPVVMQVVSETQFIFHGNEKTRTKRSYIVWCSGRKGGKKVMSTVLLGWSPWAPSFDLSFLPPAWLFDLWVQAIAAQLVSALYYLHSHRILHRDMKPQEHPSCQGWWYQALWLWVRSLTLCRHFWFCREPCPVCLTSLGLL